jgi:IS30 family transposase
MASKQRKKLDHSKRQRYVVEKLQLGWSPEQISGRIKLMEKDWLYVCPETIYQWLYEDEWAFKQEKLYQYLRFGRKKRKKHAGRKVFRSKIPNRVGIENRPTVVKRRIELGHFEGDSVIYPYKQAINTLNDLTSGIVAFTKLERKTAELTAKAMSYRLKQYSAKTLTVDNGTEMFEHEQVSNETGVSVYFADVYASWQRGSNENCNMLLRGYLPKRADIRNLTQEELDDIANELNNRPRKRLGYYTPTEKYHQLLRKSQSVALDSRM